MHNVKNAQYWTNVDMGLGQKLRETTNVGRRIGEWWDNEHYGPIMEQLREIDNNARAVAREVRKDIWDARKYMRSGYYLDVLNKLMSIDQSIKSLLSDEGLVELRAATEQHLESFYGKTQEAEPEELEQYFTSQAGLIEDMFDRWGRQRSQKMLERIYKNQIKKRKTDMNRLFNNSRSFVKKFFTILSSMGAARAKGDVGTWMKAIEDLQKESDKWSGQLRTVYNEHFKREAEQRAAQEQAQESAGLSGEQSVTEPSQESVNPPTQEGQFESFPETGDVYPTRLTGGTPVLRGVVQKYSDIVPGGAEYWIIYSPSSNEYAQIRVEGQPLTVLENLYGREITLSGGWDNAGQFVIAPEEVESQPVLPASEPAAIESAIEPAVEPAVEPATAPAIEPVVEPATAPAVEPAVEPAIEPAVEPAAVIPPIISPESEPEVSSELPPEKPAGKPVSIADTKLVSRLVDIYGNDRRAWSEGGVSLFKAINSLAHSFGDEWTSLDDVKNLNDNAKVGVEVLRKLGFTKLTKQEMIALKDQISKLKPKRNENPVLEVKKTEVQKPVEKTEVEKTETPIDIEVTEDEGEEGIEGGEGPAAIVPSVLSETPESKPVTEIIKETSGDLDKLLSYLTPERAKDQDIGGAIKRVLNVIKSRKSQGKPVPTSSSAGKDGESGTAIERLSGMAGVDLSDLSVKQIDEALAHIKSPKKIEKETSKPEAAPVIRRKKEDKKKESGEVSQRAKEIALQAEAKEPDKGEQVAMLRELADNVSRALFIIDRKMKLDPATEEWLQGLNIDVNETEKYSPKKKLQELKNDILQAIHWLRSGKKEEEKATVKPLRQREEVETSADVSSEVKELAMKYPVNRLENFIKPLEGTINSLRSGEGIDPDSKKKRSDFYEREFGVPNLNVEKLEQVLSNLKKALDWHNSGRFAEYKSLEKAKAEGKAPTKAPVPEVPELSELVSNIEQLAENAPDDYRKIRRIIKRSLLPKFQKNPGKKYSAGPEMSALLAEIGVDIEPGANIVPVIEAVWEGFKKVTRPGDEEGQEEQIAGTPVPRGKSEGPTPGMKERKERRNEPAIELDPEAMREIEEKTQQEIEQEVAAEEGSGLELDTEEESGGEVPTQWPFENVEEAKGSGKKAVQLRQQAKSLASDRLEKIKVLRDFVKSKIGIDSDQLKKLNVYIDKADDILGKKGFRADRFIEAYKGIAENFKDSISGIVSYLQSGEATEEQKQLLPEIKRLERQVYKMAELFRLEKNIKLAESRCDKGMLGYLLARYSGALESVGQVEKSITMLKKAEEILNV